MNKINVLLGIFLVSLAGCSSVPSINHRGTPDMVHADFGRYPPNYKALIHSWSETNLKNPDSLQFGRVSQPRKEWAVADAKPIYGWSVCAMISAPNAYGEYTGPQTFWFFFQGDRIVRTQQSGTISPGHDVTCDNNNPTRTG